MSNDVVVGDLDELISRVAAAATGSELLRSPVTAVDVADAERALGFRLHPLLAALYLRVGNGGFGPDDSLLPLCGEPDPDFESSVVREYLARLPPEDAKTWWAWPKDVVPVLDRGCAMFACVDCRTEAGTVLLFEPNAIRDQDVSTGWFVEAGSLEKWLETWLDGRGWYEESTGGGPAVDRWAEASERLWPGAS